MVDKVNLDMDLLRTLVTGVQLGSFSHAADRVGRSQSAVSLQLRRLEQQTGSKLFTRQGRNLVLNNTGETLYRYARHLLELNDEAVAAVTGREVAGEIRLGLPPDLAEAWLPRVLGRFSRAHPEMLIEARVDHNRNLLEDLSTNTLDIALVWSDGTVPEPAGGTNIAELPIEWIGARNISVTDAATLPLVLMRPPCLFRKKALEALQAANRPSRIAFTSHSLAGIWAAVAAGLGISVRTRMGVPPELRLLLPDNIVGSGIGSLGTVKLRAHMANAPNAAAHRFFDILMETIAGEFIP